MGAFISYADESQLSVELISRLRSRPQMPQKDRDLIETLGVLFCQVGEDLDHYHYKYVYDKLEEYYSDPVHHVPYTNDQGIILCEILEMLICLKHT